MRKPATELQRITWRHNGNLRTLKGADAQLARMAYNTIGISIETRNDIHALRSHLRNLTQIVKREQDRYRKEYKKTGTRK